MTDLTAQQLRIISLLAQGQSISQAAAAEDLHRNTITNWRRTNPSFAEALDSALTEQRHYWREQATRLAPLAMQTIEDCLTNPKSSPSLRFRAATFILKMATATHKIAQCPTEVEEFEQLASFSQPPQTAPEPPKPAQTCTRPQPIRVPPQPGRNAPCPCNSGLKFKRCCISKAA
jgi:uncharacterized protein YecA (UPF0149 family)